MTAAALHSYDGDSTVDLTGHSWGVSRAAEVPQQFSFLPFRGSDAVKRGVLTPAQLRARTWRRLFRDAYIHAAAYNADDHRMWCDAIALTLPHGGAVDGLSAALLWGVDLLRRNAPVSVSVPRSTRPAPNPRVSMTRTDVDPHDVTDFAGIPLTTPLRTAFDLGRRLPRTQAVVAIDALTRRRVVRLEALAAFADKRPRWPGIRRLSEVVEAVEPLSESPMETRLRLLLLDAGAPPLTAQYTIRDGRGGVIGRVDLAYPQWCIAIEYEGDHHREKAQFRRDVTRLNALRAAGWIVLRFTADDVMHHPVRVVQQVADAVNERR
jgi:hypothetical protein